MLLFIIGNIIIIAAAAAPIDRVDGHDIDCGY